MSGQRNSTLLTEPYAAQNARWPVAGKVLLAQYDADSVVVYQAYRPEIGYFAAENGYFGGAFSLNRMSWIKTNFLWMMYRSAWGSRDGQEVTLAIRIHRAAFNEILAQAVHSSYEPTVYPSELTWKEAGRKANVRMQWDPDHCPAGRPLPRRAVQLGLRGDVLAKYAREWVVSIEDISAFVAEQSHNRIATNSLITPREDVLQIRDATLARRLGVAVVEN